MKLVYRGLADPTHSEFDLAMTASAMKIALMQKVSPHLYLQVQHHHDPASLGLLCRQRYAVFLNSALEEAKTHEQVDAGSVVDVMVDALGGQ